MVQEQLVALRLYLWKDASVLYEKKHTMQRTHLRIRTSQSHTSAFKRQRALDPN